MAKTIRVAAAQPPEFIGEVERASAHAINLLERAKKSGASLICFPEAYLQGYVASAAHVRRFALSIDADEFHCLLSRLPEQCPTIVLGFIEALDGGYSNSAAVIQNRTIVGCYRKSHLLAQEGIFIAGQAVPLFETDELKFGINICNDVNFPEAPQTIRSQGGDLLVCCANNMLPRSVAQQWKDRHNKIRAQRCCETGLWLLSSDVTGSRDENIALGPTALLNPSGRVVAELPLGKPGLLLSELVL